MAAGPDNSRTRSRGLLLGLALALVLAVLAVAAPFALAATTVGQLFTPDNLTCGGPITVIQTGVASGNSYTVPSPGVITSWSFQDASAPLLGLKLKVAQPLPDGLNYIMVGESAGGAQQLNTVNTYPARVPVQAGDQIGIFEAGGGCDASLASGDTFAVELFDMPLNSMGPLLSETGERFPVAAVVEPDADHDGFGDETQDQCPGVAGPINGCPPPQPPPPPDKTPPGLTASARSATLSKSGAISFFVTSNENSTGTATGTISVPKLAKTVRFAKRNVTLTAGKRAKLTLKLSKNDAVLVRMALAKHKKLTAKVTLSVKDAAGNATNKRLSLSLKR